MYRLLVLVFVVFFCISCKSQVKKDAVIYVTNRTRTNVDSVVLQLNGKKHIEAVSPGETMKYIVPAISLSGYDEGGFPMNIYIAGKQFRSYFGLHDWGQFFREEERFYVFDHGINTIDEPLRKPVELTMYLVNNCKKKVDSVSIEPQLLKSRDSIKNGEKLLLNYSLFEKDPYIKVYQSGTSYRIRIENEWGNWNISQKFVFLYDDGIVSDKEL
jgi:hypothetical protein